MPTAPNEHETAGFDPSSMSILVVDDNEPNVELLLAYLEELGSKTLTARDGAEALALLLPAALLGLLSAGLVAWRLASAAEPIRDAAELSAIMGVRLMTQLRLDLRRLSQPKRKLVLLFDECQSLSIEALEQIRLLGNLRTSNRNSLEIVVAGSAELDL